MASCRTYLLFLTALCLSACAKKGDITDTRVMLTGKWKVSSMLEKVNSITPARVNNYTGSMNDYAEFKRDGYMQCSINGTTQTKKYRILSNEWLLLNADSFRIAQLMADRFTITRNEPSTLYEYTLNLTK